MDADAILSKFEAVNSDAEGYIARCPGHRDGRPSLRIWFDTDKCRMTCRAGCKTEAVLTAAGLSWRDLFDVTGHRTVVPVERAELVSGAPVARLAQYIDQTSAALHTGSGTGVRHYLERRFGVSADLARLLGLGYDPGHGFQYTSYSFTRYPRLTVPLLDHRGIAKGLQGRDLTGDCPGRWLSLFNPEGQRWLPYGLFCPDRETIVVSEGPGDGLTAVAAGCGALIVRGASLANNPELMEDTAAYLRGRDIVIAGDNDKAGRLFTEAVGTGLLRFGIVPRPLTLPRRVTDLSDWFETDPQFPTRFAAAVDRAQPMVAKPNKARDKRMAAAFQKRSTHG